MVLAFNSNRVLMSITQALLYLEMIGLFLKVSNLKQCGLSRWHK